MDSREKKADLPPKGRRNPDPITNAPGAHPIETGIGAAVAGAASGLAVGAVAGPVAAVVGAAAGAVAGGYAGKGVGEIIDIPLGRPRHALDTDTEVFLDARRRIRASLRS